MARLLDRYRRGVCTESERLLVESLHLHTYDSEEIPEDAVAKERVWQHWRTASAATGRKSRAPWLAAAAFLVLIAAVAFLFRFAADTPPDSQITDIPAGGNKAILRLADGRTVQLDSSQNGVIMLPGRLLYTDSTLVGNLLDAPAARDEAHNEIVTPKGGMYQVVLADGTKVWLNADSKLRFPPDFTKTRREVSLVGEAYFEVAKNRAQPFIIKTAGQEVQVLGTSFNVTAYPDAVSEQTTLVEGKVSVSTRQTARQLSPGDQAVVGASGISVEKVDTAPFVAWKSGFIAFNEETLEHIMRDISRWYNVDVHFEGADKQLRFGGMVSRYANVSEVLRRLELTGQVHFKIEEKRIVVTP